jgi:archaellum biogenesis protein FlaJ (TadC family)
MRAAMMLEEEGAPRQGQIPWLERRLRWAGVLIALGLVVQLLTFIRIHPFVFIAFALIGCPLVLAGMLLYLHLVVSHQPDHDDGRKSKAELAHL